MAHSRESSEEETLIVPAVRIAAEPAAAERALLLVLSGPAMGQSFTIGPQPAVVGRGEDSAVAIQDPGISRHHAVVAFADGVFTVADMGSANGTLVNGARIAQVTPLAEADRIQLGPHTLLKFSRLDALEAEVQRRLNEAVHTDVLTGVGNRRFLEKRLRDEFAHASRHRRPLCVLMIDVDHFKAINDLHGHAVGDLALRAIAAKLLAEVRIEDVLARYGGEEFIIVARDLTPDQGLEFAERLRARVQASPLQLPDGGRISVTISIGIAALRPDHDADAEALIVRADEALYAAKQRGRNRVEYYA